LGSPTRPPDSPGAADPSLLRPNPRPSFSSALLRNVRPCAAPGQRLVPSCGEHRGRGWKGRRRRKSLCFLPTSTPRRTRLIADAAPLPAVESHSAFLPARRVAPFHAHRSPRLSPGLQHGPRTARNLGRFQARSQGCRSRFQRSSLDQNQRTFWKKSKNFVAGLLIYSWGSRKTRRCHRFPFSAAACRERI